MNYRELYNTNKEIQEYVDKYADSNGITVDTALTHKMVQEYITYKNRLNKVGKNM